MEVLEFVFNAFHFVGYGLIKFEEIKKNNNIVNTNITVNNTVFKPAINHNEPNIINIVFDETDEPDLR